MKEGVSVAGVVEVADEVRGDPTLRRRLEGEGVTFYLAHTVKEARGASGEVESVVVVRLDSELAPIARTETDIA